MAISAVFGSRVPCFPQPSFPSPAGTYASGARSPPPNLAGGLIIECSSRPQKKATAHHMKTRPRKRQPWDVRRRGPTVYPPLPPLPPEWTLVTGEDQAAGVPSSSTPQPVEKE